jgi:NOL1/NOP2/fmu family ribosome biogenesis protein
MQNDLQNAGFEFVPFDELTAFGISKVENQLGYQFLPGKVESEGFFISVWKNKNSSQYLLNKKKHKKQSQTHLKIPFSLPENKKTLVLNNEIYAVPNNLDEFLFDNLTIKYAGVKIGKQIKNKWKPAIEMVYTNSFKHLFPEIELDFNQALLYLKGNTTINLPNKKTKEYYTVTFKNYPLGLIHYLGNRFNNLHPKPWRIKMNIPDNQKETPLF